MKILWYFYEALAKLKTYLLQHTRMGNSSSITPAQLNITKYIKAQGIFLPPPTPTTVFPLQTFMLYAFKVVHTKVACCNLKLQSRQKINEELATLNLLQTIPQKLSLQYVATCTCTFNLNAGQNCLT